MTQLVEEPIKQKDRNKLHIPHAVHFQKAATPTELLWTFRLALGIVRDLAASRGSVSKD
jgi:hypothetical protein